MRAWQPRQLFGLSGKGARRPSLTNGLGDAGPQAPRPATPQRRSIAATIQDTRLATYRGKRDTRFTLLPRLRVDNAGLVTIWNDNGAAYLEFWRSVFERRAPTHIAPVEQIIAPLHIGQGNSVKQIDDSLLDALTAAYREAADGRIIG